MPFTNNHDVASYQASQSRDNIKVRCFIQHRIIDRLYPATLENFTKPAIHQEVFLSLSSMTSTRKMYSIGENCQTRGLPRKFSSNANSSKNIFTSGNQHFSRPKIFFKTVLLPEAEQVRPVFCIPIFAGAIAIRAGLC